MGDLKENQAGDGAKPEGEKMEAVEIENEQNEALEANLAINAKMAALMLNPVAALPKDIRRKVNALKKIQDAHVHLEAEFFKELHELEIKYEKIFDPLYEKRAAIVTGAHDPTEEECDYVTEAEKELQNSGLSAGDNVNEDDKVVKGIPEFWLTAFKNAPALGDMIEEYDEDILKHLTNVKSITNLDPMSFDLEFHFEPNEYFTDSVLTKHYELKCTPDEADVFTFEGPEIVKCSGCSIDWKKGKNVTVKTIKKKQKHKARGAVRTVTKTIANDSFFNFFSPPAEPENVEEMDEESQSILSQDFEIGNLIKDRIIPHAVLFFTGENLIDEDFEDEDEEDEDEYDEDEDEEEEEDDENDGQCLTRKKSKGPPSGNQPAPPECKQQ